MFGTFALGTGLGPYLMGLSYHAWQLYNPMLMIFEFAFAVTCSLFFRLGPILSSALGPTWDLVSEPRRVGQTMSL
jgi:hypothetical protein